MLIGCAGLWGVGRSTTADSRTLLATVVVGALAVSAVAGMFQVGFGIEYGSLALASGRPTGLTANPVYFGALSAGGLVGALALRRTTAKSQPLLIAVFVLGCATSMSGSRVALAAAVAGLMALVAVHRDRPTARLSAFGAGSLVVGVVLDRVLGEGRNSVDRLADGAAGGRSDVWRYAIKAWSERPVLGYGPGQFRAAVQGRFEVDFVRDHASDDLTQAWFDAHNVLINMLIAVGVVGVVADRSVGRRVVAAVPRATRVDHRADCADVVAATGVDLHAAAVLPVVRRSRACRQTKPLRTRQPRTTA